MSSDESPGELAIIDKTMPFTRANVVALGLALVVILVFFTLYILIWGGETLWAVLDDLISPFLLVFVLSVVAHEVLHGLGCVLVGDVSWSEVEFAFKGLMVYAHCTVPVSAFAYRVSLALPGVVLGLVPSLVGLALGSAWLTVYGTLMVIAALGDFLILWMIWSVPSEVQVQDHPSAPGCQVFLKQRTEGDLRD